MQALRLCQKAGLVKLGNVAIDGTKIMANASLHRSISYSKLTEREQYWKETIEKLLNAAEQTDREEDQKWGAGKTGEELPAELAHAKSRLERIRRAKQELEEEARQQLEEAQKHFTPRPAGRPRKDAAPVQKEDTQQRQRAKKRLLRARNNASEPERQYNFVDPDSRVMLDNARKCYTQAYNHGAYMQVIVAAELTQQTVDRQQLIPMAEAVQKSNGQPTDRDHCRHWLLG